MDGPVVGDAKKAIDKNNVNYVLKWILPENEKEIKQTFDLIMKVRGFSPDAEKLADKYDHVLQIIPWALSGLFLLISVLFGVLYFRNSQKRIG